MNLPRTWSLAILLLGLAGCSGTPTASTGPAKSAAELMDDGDKALAAGNLEPALAAFTGAVDAQNDSAQARQRRAAVLLKMKQFDKAVADCNEALRIDGKLVPAYVTRGLAEKGLGETDKALEDLTKAVEAGNPQADALAARGAIYYSMAKAVGKPDEAAQILDKAQRDFDRAVELDSQPLAPRLQRAAICLDTGDYSRAVADCDALLKADPHLADARVIRARGKFEQGNLDEALADCDAAIGLDKGLLEAYVVRAKARVEKSSLMRTVAEVQECGQAADDCHAALELAKKFHGDADAMRRLRTLRGQSHESRGAIYHALGATPKALTEYGQALVLDPYLISAMLGRAVARSVGGDSAGAMYDCERAIHTDSSRAEAYSGRGFIYAMSGDYPKAIDDFTLAVKLDRKCAKAYLGRAQVRWQMAVAELLAAKKAANRIDLNSHLAKASEYRQNCIDDSTRAIETSPHLARAYLTRGLANQSLPEKALTDFNAAIREDPRMVRAYFNRAVLFFNNRQVDAAIKDFEEAEKLRPNSDEIDKRLLQCYQQKQDPIMINKYYMQLQEKVNRERSRVEQELEVGDLIGGHKAKGPVDAQSDADLDPLNQAKRALEKKLDQTADKEEAM